MGVSIMVETFFLKKGFEELGPRGIHPARAGTHVSLIQQWTVKMNQPLPFSEKFTKKYGEGGTDGTHPSKVRDPLLLDQMTMN